jgi:hypothetical protein
MVAGLIPLLLIPLGLWWMLSQRDLFQDGLRSYFWPQAKGRIIDREDRSFFGPGLVGGTATGVGLVEYRETGYFYEYEVGLTRYVGDMYCFGVHLDKALARYIVGDRVKVYYNPKNPREAVLRHGLRSGTMASTIPFVVGMAYLVWLLSASGMTL